MTKYEVFLNKTEQFRVIVNAENKKEAEDKAKDLFFAEDSALEDYFYNSEDQIFVTTFN